MHNKIPFLVPAVSVHHQIKYKAQAAALSERIKADDAEFESAFYGPLTSLASHLQQGNQHRLQHASFYHTLCAHIEGLKAVKAKFMDEHSPKQNPVPTFSFYPEQWKIEDTTSMMLARSMDKKTAFLGHATITYPRMVVHVLLTPQRTGSVLKTTRTLWTSVTICSRILRIHPRIGQPLSSSLGRRKSPLRSSSMDGTKLHSSTVMRDATFISCNFPSPSHL